MKKKRIRIHVKKPTDNLYAAVMQRKRRYKIKAFALKYKGRKLY